jgi:ketosteroid isomerase-like protein
MTKEAVMTVPGQLLERMRAAIDAHDLDALERCFAPGYLSEQPAHPARSFTGTAQLHRNWEQIFGAVPDLRATLVRRAVIGDTAWAEWDWSGTRRDGADFAMRGVTIQDVHAARIARLRFYMEPVEAGGAGIDAAIRERTA